MNDELGTVQHAEGVDTGFDTVKRPFLDDGGNGMLNFDMDLGYSGCSQQSIWGWMKENEDLGEDYYERLSEDVLEDEGEIWHSES